MRNLQAAGAFLVIAMLGSCAPRPAPPTPAPPPPPVPAPEPPAPPAPVDWRDAALSPGDWSYREGQESSAAFGPASGPALVLRCESSRQVSLTRVGATGGGGLTVRTTFGERTLPASAQPGGGLVATVAATDPLLDQMVFSRGRFLVQVTGEAPLIVPAWPEPARVIEDCRG